MIIWIDCQVTGPYLPIYTRSQPGSQLAILALLVIYSILKPLLRGKSIVIDHQSFIDDDELITTLHLRWPFSCRVGGGSASTPGRPIPLVGPLGLLCM